MKNYLQELENKITLLLPVNSYFTLDDSEQSYNIYPTNHVNVCNDYTEINIAHVIYGNITEYQEIIDNVKELYSLCSLISGYTGEYASINKVSNDCYRLLLGGLDSDQQSFDFTTVKDLIDYMKSLY